MVTNIGEFLRKLRIEHNEVLYNMAKKLDVAIPLLSAVENGKKRMPEDWQTKIDELYNLSEAQKIEFRNAIAEDNGVTETRISEEKSLKEVTIYNFEVELEYLDEYKAEKGRDYTVHLKVLAEDQFKARKMLEEWLSNPKQTGWKYKNWLGITPMPSELVIIQDGEKLGT